MTTAEKILVDLFVAKSEYEKFRNNANEIPDDQHSVKNYVYGYKKATAEYRDKLQIAFESGYALSREQID